VSSNRIIMCVVATAWVASFSAAPASAQTFDQRVFFTFSGPVELPGVTLPAGKYIFRLPDPMSTQNVVQVLSDDGTKSHGIFFTAGAYRLEPAPQPEIRFMETPAGTPPAVRAYWNQGETSGHEFIYPKEHARRVANTSKQPVLTTTSHTTTTEQTNTPSIVRLSADGSEAKVDAGTKPAPSAPIGPAQPGSAAPASIEIPRVVVVLVPVAGGR
jgi:hypothetical protein